MFLKQRRASVKVDLVPRLQFSVFSVWPTMPLVDLQQNCMNMQWRLWWPALTCFFPHVIDPKKCVCAFYGESGRMFSAGPDGGAALFLCPASGCSLSEPGKIISEVIQFRRADCSQSGEWILSLFATFCPGSTLAQFVAHFCFQSGNQIGGRSSFILLKNVASSPP